MEDINKDVATPETKTPDVVIEDVEVLEPEVESVEAPEAVTEDVEAPEAETESVEAPDAEAEAEAEAEEAPEADAPKEKNYKVSKRTGILLICGSIAVGALAVLAAYKGRELRRAKASARRSIAYTDVDLYDKADRKRIRKLEKRSMKKVDKAKNRTSVRLAKDEYDDSLDGFQTRQEKLANEKLDAVTEAYEELLKEKSGSKSTAAAAVSKIAAAAGADTVARMADAAATKDTDTESVRDYVEDIRAAENPDQVKKLRREHRSGAKKHHSGKF